MNSEDTMYRSIRVPCTLAIVALLAACQDANAPQPSTARAIDSRANATNPLTTITFGEGEAHVGNYSEGGLVFEFGGSAGASIRDVRADGDRELLPSAAHTVVRSASPSGTFTLVSLNAEGVGTGIIVSGTDIEGREYRIIPSGGTRLLNWPGLTRLDIALIGADQPPIDDIVIQHEDPCTVTTLDDAGLGSLRQRLANTSCATVDFDESILPAEGQGEIKLTSADLSLTRSVTIAGPGADRFAISGDNARRVFSVSGAGVKTISGLTIRNASGGFNAGAIWNTFGELRLSDVVLENNRADQGAALANDRQGIVTVERTTFRGNEGEVGAAIYNVGTATIHNSTFTGNTGTQGTAVYNRDGTATVVNSTISGNQSHQGVIWNAGALDLSFVTVTGNTGKNAASIAGVLLINAQPSTPSNRIFASIIAGNSTVERPDCMMGWDNTFAAPPPAQGDYNLLGGGSCQFENATVTLSGDARLGALASNGGVTLTHLPLLGSPAVDKVPAALCIATDQRGVQRPRFAGCDIGAVESETPKDVATLALGTGGITTARFGTPLVFAGMALDQSPPVTSPARAAMSIHDGGSCAAPGPVLGSEAHTDHFVVTNNNLSVGHHTLLLCYSGNDYFQPGSRTVELEITPADDTPPSIVPTVTGTVGANGWYTSDVVVSWNVTDDESDVSSQAGCAPTTVAADTDGLTIECSATSAGGTASNSVTLKRDASAPVVAFTGATTYSADQVVAISCGATDVISRIATQTCPGASGPAYSFKVGSTTLNATATDNAGLTTTASATFTISVTYASLKALTSRFVTNAKLAASLNKKLDAAAAAEARGHWILRAVSLVAYGVELVALPDKHVSKANTALLVRLLAKL